MVVATCLVNSFLHSEILKSYGFIDKTQVCSHDISKIVPT